MKYVVFLVFLLGLAELSVASDHEKSHEKHHQKLNKRGHHHHRKHNEKVYKYRYHDGPTTECNCTCCPIGPGPVHPPEDNGIEVIYNDRLHLIGLVNVTSNTALLFVKGKSEVLLDTHNGVIAVVESGQINLLEVFKLKQPIVSFLSPVIKAKITTLPQIFPKGPEFKNSSVEHPSEAAQKLLVNVLASLGSHKGNANISYAALVKLGPLLEETLYHELSGLLKGSGAIRTPTNLNRFLAVAEGLKFLFLQTDGGLAALTNASVHLDIKLIFNDKNGVQVLLSILQQIGTRVDLVKLFGKVLNDQEVLLKTIVLLGGNCSKGINGLFKILYNFVGFLKGHISLEEVIEALKRVIADHDLEINPALFKELIEGFLKVAESQEKRFHNGDALKPFTEFWKNLLDNTLIINNINISDIVKLVKNGDFKNGLEFIAKILAKLGNPAKTIPALFKSYLSLLNSTKNGDSLSSFLPGLDLKNLTSFGDGNILQTIYKHFDIKNILSPSGCNVTSVLSKIPGFGDFFKAVSQAYNFSGSISLDKYLNAKTVLIDFKHVLSGRSILEWAHNFQHAIQQEVESGVSHFSDFVNQFNPANLLGGGETKPSNEEAKPSNEEEKPSNEEAKPSNEEEKPSNEEAKPSNEEVKPSSEEAKPSSNEEAKPSSNEEAKPSSNEEAKPSSNEEAKPSNEEEKPTNEETKPENEEAKPSGEEAKPSNEEAKTSTGPSIEGTTEESRHHDHHKVKHHHSQKKSHEGHHAKSHEKHHEKSHLKSHEHHQ